MPRGEVEREREGGRAIKLIPGAATIVKGVYRGDFKDLEVSGSEEFVSGKMISYLK